MSELMCSQSKCRRKDEHIAELEDDNRRLSEIEQRRIGEAITQANSIAELREQLAELREAAQAEVDRQRHQCGILRQELQPTTAALASLLQEKGNE